MQTTELPAAQAGDEATAGKSPQAVSPGQEALAAPSQELESHSSGAPA